MSLKILNNVKLSDYTSWLVGGEAEYFCLPETLEDLQEALYYAKEKKLPITVFGGGSNILISDQGISGLTICLRRFSKITTNIDGNRLIIEATSGVAKSELLKIFLKTS